jgi:hypothetical protein
MGEQGFDTAVAGCISSQEWTRLSIAMDLKRRPENSKRYRQVDCAKKTD